MNPSPTNCPALADPRAVFRYHLAAMPPCIIFDMDGVLIASEPAHQASWRALARRHKLTLADDAFRDLFGRPSRDIIRALWGDLPDDQVRRLDAEKEALFRELITGLVPVTVGARELVVALSRDGFKLAIATSAPPENLELVLRETNLARFFSACVHGFDIQRGKPAPDCFLLAAQRAGAPPADCAVIEDAPVGIAAALAAGMKVVGLAGTHAPQRLAAAGASRVVRRLGELSGPMLRELIAAP